MAQPAVNQERPIELQLDDTALGIALADRWATLPRPSSRAAWLEGTWDAWPAPPTLRVTRWLRPIVQSELEAAGFARRTVPAATAAALVAALAQLGADVPLATKEDACRHLVAAGLAAAPLLRAVARRRPPVRAARRREPHQPAGHRTARAGVRHAHRRHPLRRTAAPDRDTGTAPDDRPPRQGAQRAVLAIRDWRAFWQRRQGQTLAAIHAELEPLVDAYCARGTTQQVD